jgi:chemotaxis protein CheZ
LRSLAEPSSRRGDGVDRTAPGDDVHTELRALRALFEQHRGGAGEPQTPESAELRKLRAETDLIHRAIRQTKDELAVLRVNGSMACDEGRVARELDAVLAGSEQATQQILTAAEDIDQAANMLSAAAKDEQQQGLAQDIQDHVIRIFEACNFQDVSGQRIAKVLETMSFIEERVTRMLTIWGDVNAFRAHVVVAAVAPSEQGEPPVNGPKLDDEPGHATQADIDAMFA